MAAAAGEILKIARKHGVLLRSPAPSSIRGLGRLLIVLVPVIYIVMLWRFMQRMVPPKNDVGKPASRRRRRPLRGFDAVAGIDVAKRELEEVVDFIRRPGRYTAVGARFPKGVLLHGPSGTGKTLLARAVARESGISFISCSASDFVETFVGRGAARIRDIFRRASEAAPCVLFIDELDAVGQTRGGLHSHDEREQTLNQLLIEMDGFEAEDSGVLVLAATNRPQVLDGALLRSGRFDRHVEVPLPDEAGREAILRVHLRALATAGDLPVGEVAAGAAGYSGAELACLANEAALLAVRHRKGGVDGACLREAFERMQRSRSTRLGGGASLSFLRSLGSQ